MHLTSFEGWGMALDHDISLMLSHFSFKICNSERGHKCSYIKFATRKVVANRIVNWGSFGFKSVINICNQKFGLISVSKQFQAGRKSDVKGKKQKKKYYFHFILQFPIKNYKLTNTIIIINKKNVKYHI